MKHCKVVFLGGSIIKHGGQNPIEAVRNGCRVIHGPYIHNFYEVYKLLDKYKITKKISTSLNAVKEIKKVNFNKAISNKIKTKLNFVGKKILNKNYSELKKYL